MSPHKNGSSTMPSLSNIHRAYIVLTRAKTVKYKIIG